MMKTARRHRKTKKQLIENSPCGLFGNGSLCRRDLRGEAQGWLGKWGTKINASTWPWPAGVTRL
jgi:hypothetical protein